MKTKNYSNELIRNGLALLGVLTSLALLAACAPPVLTTATVQQVAQTEFAAVLTQTQIAAPSATLTPLPVPTSTPTPTLPPTATLPPTPDTRPDPEQWANWPVIPTLSAVGKEIYQKGIAKGNAAQVFSVVGDCQSEPNVFMGFYETDRLRLSDQYKYLQETIDYYKGSFSSKSLAVRDGLDPAGAMTSLWADQNVCKSNESMVACELRVRKPSVMFVNLGTNWRADASTVAYEKALRAMVQLIVDNGTLPILMTKADNVEGDNSINRATARVAHDFDVPLLNFWLGSNDLPNHGLDDSDAHKVKSLYLTPDAWDRRNFLSLLTLDGVRRGLLGLPTP
jgi:hypothetical protein